MKCIQIALETCPFWLSVENANSMFLSSKTTVRQDSVRVTLPSQGWSLLKAVGVSVICVDCFVVEGFVGCAMSTHHVHVPSP